MGDREAKDALFDAFAEVAKALGNGRRAELIDVLAQGERHVDELAGGDRPERRQHLVPSAGARRRRPGHDPPRRHPHLLPARLRPGRRAVGGAARRRRRPSRPARRARRRLPRRPRPAGADRPRRARRAGSRPATSWSSTSDPTAEYAAGHIAGARSIPIDELAASSRTCPPSVEVVAYCRGPYCVFADDAVRLLRRRGRRARRLEDGYPEWQRAELPVEMAAAS